MADSSTREQQDQQYEQQTGSDQPKTEGQPFADHPSFGDMSSIMAQFNGLTGQPSGGAYEFTTQLVQAYVEGLQREARRSQEHLDETIRTTKKVADVWALKMITQDTVLQLAQFVAPVVKQQVITELRQNQAWARQILQEAGVQIGR